MTDDLITIPTAEYNSLLRDSNWLTCLESAGVDNWEGIDYAYDLQNGANEDELI